MASEDVKEKEEKELTMEVTIPKLLQSPGIEIANQYGFLSELNGIWHNKGNSKDGLNIISLPSPNTIPTDPVSGFTPVFFRYYETLTFTLNNLARNRGGVSQQFNGVVKYNQIVKGSETSVTDPSSPNTTQHIEDGMYLYLNNVSLEDSSSGKDIYKPQYNYCRSGTVPHGNSLMLFGNELDKIEGSGPNFDPTGPLQDYVNPVSLTMEEAGIGYAEKLTDGLRPNNDFPHEALKRGIEGKTIKETRTLFLSSENKGNITNTPFITEFADTTKMDVFLWLETIDNGDGTTCKQLQYLQKMILKFQKTGDKIIEWPHITCNTLTLKE